MAETNHTGERPSHTHTRKSPGEDAEAQHPTTQTGEGSKKDDLWEHTADQFWFDLGILTLMVLVFTVVLRVCVSNAAAKLRHR